MDYLATWFYAEQSDNMSDYPQVMGKTSTISFQKTYWKCVYTFFYSAIKMDRKREYLFFSNVVLPENIEGIDYKNFFERNHIQYVYLDLSYKIFKDWYGSWRNQFYVFDILDWMKDNKKTGALLLLDSDCLIMRPLDELFRRIREETIVAYCYGYQNDHKINGLTILEMKKLYERYYDEDADELTYWGGELIAVDIVCLSKLLEELKYLWKVNYQQFRMRKKKLNEEAHFLSFLYYRLGLRASNAGYYIKRIWATVSFDNREATDCEKAIWHCPAEKMLGFKRLYATLKKGDMDDKKFYRICQKYFGLPQKDLCGIINEYIFIISRKVYKWIKRMERNR